MAQTLASIKPMMKQAVKELGLGHARSSSSSSGQRSPAAALLKTVGSRLGKSVAAGTAELSETPMVNSLYPGSRSKSVQFSNAVHSTRVTHREYLQDVITGSVAGVFNLDVYNLNPGLSFTFPYLASIAQNFEEYHVHGLVFEFVSSASTYAAGTAMGTVIMAMEYNAAQPAFTNKLLMENSDYAVSARFDKNMVYGVECGSHAQNTFYVRNGASSLPITSTDVGAFYIATQPSASLAPLLNIGELWVSYDVELIRPRLGPSRWGSYHQQIGAIAAGSPGPVTSNGTSSGAPTVYGSLTNASTSWFITSPTLSTYSFPDAAIGDVYQVTVLASTATGTWTQGFALTLTKFSVFNFLDLQSGSAGNLSIATGLYAVGVFFIQVNGADPSFVLTSGTAGGASNGDVFIVNLGNGYTINNL